MLRLRLVVGKVVTSLGSGGGIKKITSTKTGPDSANGRASTSGAGGRRFNTWLCHTKGFKWYQWLPCLVHSIIRQARSPLTHY